MIPVIAVFFWVLMGGFNPVLPAGSGVLPVFNGPTVTCGISTTDPSEISYPLLTSTSPCAGPYRNICFTQGGYFNVNLQMSFAPGPAAEGSVTIDSVTANMTDYWARYFDPLPRSTMALYWKAGSGYTLQGNVVTIYAYPNECFILNYSSTAQATINTDWRATRLTISKIH
jgi:hypothetical protein